MLWDSFPGGGREFSELAVTMEKDLPLPFRAAFFSEIHNEIPSGNFHGSQVKTVIEVKVIHQSLLTFFFFF